MRCNILLILLIIFTATCGSGCWDRKPLMNLAIVIGMGVDRTPDGKFITTFQVVKAGEAISGASNSQNDSGGSTAKSAAAVWTTQSEAATNYAAARANRFQTSHDLYFPQVQVFIIGQAAARQGIRASFDLTARYPLMRMTQMVLIAKGTANEILRTPDPLNKIPAQALVSILNYSFKTAAQVLPVRQIDLMKLLISKTRAGVIPQVEVATDGQEKLLRLNGMAIIKKNRYIGELSRKETKGLLWVTGQARRALLEITNHSGQGLATLEVIKANTQLQPELHGQQVIIKLNVQTEASLVDLMTPENWTTSEKLHQLGQKGSAIIHQEILNTWKIARRLNADFYGFGEAISRQYPREWKSLEPRWDHIFPRIKLAVKVETNVTNTSGINKPILPQ